MSNNIVIRQGRACSLLVKGQDMNNSPSRLENAAQPVSILTVLCTGLFAPANTCLFPAVGLPSEGRPRESNSDPVNRSSLPAPGSYYAAVFPRA